MRPMSPEVQAIHRQRTEDVRAALKSLKWADTQGESEDLQVAIARVENWLAENAGRWVA